MNPGPEGATPPGAIESQGMRLKTARRLVRLLIPLSAGLFGLAFLDAIKSSPSRSAAYPRLLIALLLLVALYNLVAEWRTGGRTDAGHPDHGRSLRGVWWVRRPAILTAALVAGFVFALPRLGFYVTSTIFIPTVTVLLGIRKPIVVGAFTVGFIIAAYLLFDVMLEVPFPAGWLR